jgi:hypothetical protein
MGKIEFDQFKNRCHLIISFCLKAKLKEYLVLFCVYLKRNFNFISLIRQFPKINPNYLIDINWLNNKIFIFYL